MKARHEYRYSFEGNPLTKSDAPYSNFQVRNPARSDVPELAALMYDSYQGTIDYDGETLQEATKEVESYFERLDMTPLLSCSFVALSEGHIISACLVSRWEKRPEPMISYIMTRGNFKGRGLGKALVGRAIRSIRDAGHDGASAFVTEGNTQSERILVSLGFRIVQ